MVAASTLKIYADNLNTHTSNRQVGVDHKPTTEELNNIAYTSMRYLARWPMRATDFTAVIHTAGPINNMDDLFDKFVPTLGRYIWEFLMNKPDTPLVGDVQYAAHAFANLIYSLDESTRNQIGPVVYEGTDQAKAMYDQIKQQIPPEISECIDNTACNLVHQTGFTAKATLGRFILMCAPNKKIGAQVLEESIASYDQTYVNFSAAYDDDFKEQFKGYIIRLLTNIWFSFQLVGDK